MRIPEIVSNLSVWHYTPMLLGSTLTEDNSGRESSIEVQSELQSKINKLVKRLSEIRKEELTDKRQEEEKKRRWELMVLQGIKEWKERRASNK